MTSTRGHPNRPSCPDRSAWPQSAGRLACISSRRPPRSFRLYRSQKSFNRQIWNKNEADTRHESDTNQKSQHLDIHWTPLVTLPCLQQLRFPGPLRHAAEPRGARHPSIFHLHCGLSLLLDATSCVKSEQLSAGGFTSTLSDLAASYSQCCPLLFKPANSKYTILTRLVTSLLRPGGRLGRSRLWAAFNFCTTCLFSQDTSLDSNMPVSNLRSLWSTI